MTKILFLILPYPVIFLLTVKIGEAILFKKAEKVKGTETRINIESLNFHETGGNLKYFYEIQPNYPYSWKTDFLPNTIENSINSDTLNERFDYKFKKPERNFRIITLGDSHVFGLYVETPQNFSELTENKLNDSLKCSNIDHFDVINLGVSGYDVEYSVERLISRGLKYEPDLVIWMLNEWNFQNINEKTMPIMIESKNKGIKMFDTADKKFTITESALDALNSKYSKKEILNYQLKAIRRLLQNYKGKLLIISYPGLPEDYKSAVKKIIRNEGKNANYSEDLPDIVKIQEYHFLDFHPNQKGHRKISDTISKLLSKQFLPDCASD